MKIIFIGGVKFSHAILEKILSENFSVEVIFSYNESKKFFYSDMTSFDDLSQKYMIKNVKVNNINDEENVKLINEIQPDIIFVFGWSQLLKNEILKIPKLGVIGSHPTELPKYRGRAPIPWSIIKGLKESALTFFYISPGIDDGDILSQETFQITPIDDATSIYQKMIELGKKMICECLPLLETGMAKRIPQNPENFIENWSKRIPEDGRIDWTKSAKEINTLIRATTNPYPGAFTYFKNSKIIIWKSIILDSTSEGVGKIMNIVKNQIYVGTGSNILIITDYTIDNQINNKNSKLDQIKENNIGSFFDK